MNSNDFVNTYSYLRTILRDADVSASIDPNEKEKYLLRVNSWLPKIVDLVEAELKAALANAAVAVATAPRLLEMPTDFSTSQPFEDLFKFYGRDVADSLRVWFKDLEGGFDSSTVEDRKTVYGKARNHYESKSTTTTAVNPPSNPRPTVVKDKPKRKNGPCPDCEDSRKVTTRYGERWRCDTHDYWGNA